MNKTATMGTKDEGAIFMIKILVTTDIFEKVFKIVGIVYPTWY